MINLEPSSPNITDLSTLDVILKMVPQWVQFVWNNLRANICVPPQDYHQQLKMGPQMVLYP